VMKILVRSLQGEPFGLEISLSEKVHNLKKKVASLRPEFPVDKILLVHSGKILPDEVTVQDGGLKEGDFVVVTIPKPKAAPPSSPLLASNSAASATAPSAVTAPSVAVAVAPTAPAEAPAAAPAVAAAAAAAAVASTPTAAAAGLVASGPAAAPEVTTRARAAGTAGPKAFAMVRMASAPTDSASQAEARVTSRGVAHVAAADVDSALAAAKAPVPAPTSSFQVSALAMQGTAAPGRPAALARPVPDVLGQQPSAEQIPEAAMTGGLPTLLAANAPHAAQLAVEEEGAISRLVGLGFDRATCLEAPAAAIGAVAGGPGGSGAGQWRPPSCHTPRASTVPAVIPQQTSQRMNTEAYLKCQKDEDLAASHLLEALYEGNESTTPAGSYHLEQLRKDPKFKALAEVVTEKPQILGQLIEAVAVRDPEVARAVREHKQEFLRMAEETLGERPLSPVEVMLAAAGAEPQHAPQPQPPVEPVVARPAGGGQAATQAPQSVSPASPSVARPPQTGAAVAQAPQRAMRVTNPMQPTNCTALAAARPARAGNAGPQAPSVAPQIPSGRTPRGTRVGTQQLSADDETTISRLAGTLGFDRIAVREMYITCGGDEQVTANELFLAEDMRRESNLADAAELPELPEPRPVPWHAENKWQCFANARHCGDDLEYSGQNLDLEEAMQWAEDISNCVGFTMDRWTNPPTVWFHAAVHPDDCVDEHHGFDLYVHRERFVTSNVNQQNSESLPASQDAIRLSAADQEAVQRLAGLGFSTEAALEAYLACGRNEEYAGSFLFSDANGF